MPSRIPIRKNGPPKGQTYRPPAPQSESAEAARERHLFYGRVAWLKCRALALRLNPFCQRCLEKRVYEPATDVHHIIDLADAPELAYTLSNLACWCHSCHSRETKHRQINGKD